MAKRNVVWTRIADIQFVGILEYWVIKNKSNSYSKKLVNLVAERTKQISEKPFIYKSTNFKDTRVAAMGNFSIFFKITKDQIIISAFWDNRQDPKIFWKYCRILHQKVELINSNFELSQTFRD